MAAKNQIEDIYPLSPLQQGIHYHVSAEPESLVYWNQLTARIDGVIDENLFHQAWQCVVDSHTVLRTGFVFDKQGRALQIVFRRVELPWSFDDWSALEPREQAAALDRYMSQDRASPPDLRRAPLMRVALFRLAPSRYTLVWSQHHIILDGWSGALLMKSVFDAYSRLLRGEDPAFRAGGSFADYLQWLDRKDMEAAENFWRDYFVGFQHTGDVVDAAPSGARYSQIEKTLSVAQTGALHKLARSCRVTLNTVLQCAWALALAAETGDSKITTGVTITDRPAEIAAVDEIVGLLLATLPMNLDVSSSLSIDDWLRQSQDRFSEACEYSASLREIQSWSGRASTRPLFDSLLVFENFPFADNMAQSAGLRIDDFEAVEFTNYPLTLEVAPLTELRLKLVYQAEISSARAQNLMDRLRFMLENLCIDVNAPVSSLALTTAEENDCVAGWNAGSAASLSASSLLDWFSATVDRLPGKVAASCGETSLSYAELERASSVLAGALIAAGVAQDQLVGIVVPRSELLPVALLGVLKAGAGYVPLDRDFPVARLEHMLADSGCNFLVSAGALPIAELADCVIDINELDLFAEPDEAVQAELARRKPAAIAYLIYTSGSTGKPKGVAVGHDQLLNLLASMSREPGLGEDDRLLAVTTLSFDIAMLELLGPLMVGATLQIAAADAAADGRLLAQLIERCQPTIMQATPATWSMLIAAGWRGAPSLRVWCGGEALDRRLADELLARSGSLWNLYGPTETTIWSTCRQITAGDGPILVGKPIANTQTLILDANRRVLPVGVPGELYIGGHGVARGYWRREELTRERFVTLPHLAEARLTDADARWFRTGDSARWHADGAIELFGRKDNQIKLRGYRIEPEEIEAALCEYPGIDACCVVLRPVEQQDSRLVAYYLSKTAAQPSAMQLRRHLGERLPRYMIPQQFTLLDELPLTPNAKLDRRLLTSGDPQPGIRQAPSEALRAPSSASEKYYAEIWRELLDADEIGVDDTFFDIGGHSLLSMQFVARVGSDRGIAIPLQSLLSNSLAELAEGYPIDREADAEAQAEPAVDIKVARQRDHFPLSPFQQRLCLLEKIDASAGAHNLTRVFRMGADFRVDKMIKALHRLAATHEILRASYAFSDDEFVQRISAEVVVDQQTLPGPKEDEIQSLLNGFANHRYHLESGPLWFVRFIPMAECCYFVLSFHHSIFDGESIPVLFDSLSAFYTDPECGGFEPGIQFGDFAAWHNLAQQQPHYERDRAYWLEQLAGELPVFDFPAFRPRPPMQDFAGALETCRVDAELVESLRVLARRENTTLFNIALMAAYVTLSGYTNQDDLVVGIPVSSREFVTADNLIGPYVNTLPLRLNIGRDLSVAETLSKVTRQSIDALNHRMIPFEALIADLKLNRDLSRSPVYQVLFSYRRGFRDNWKFPGLEMDEVPLEQTMARTDMSWWIEERDELCVDLEFATSVVDRAMAAQVLGHFRQVLGELARRHDDSSIPPLSTDDDLRRISQWNAGSAASLSASSLLDWFSATVDRLPGKVAASCGETSLSYAELERASSVLAGALIAAGVAQDQLVGIVVPRSELLPVALLGVLKAGAGYVPLDRDFPVARLEHMLADSGCNFLVSAGALPIAELADCVIDINELDLFAEPDEAVQAELARRKPAAIAYLIYTSGSTGKPKGVAVGHDQLLNLLASMSREPGLGEDDRLLAVTTLSFDIAMLELLGPLMVGATLQIAAADAAADGRLLAQLIERCQPTIMQATPATWSMLIAAGWRGAPSLRVWCGGEALDRRLADELLARSGSLWNLYGPTETTIWSTCRQITAGDGPILVGKPIANTQTLILDANRRVLPVGVPGELYIGGHGVARGYWRREELTRERFVTLPHLAEARLTDADARWFRTGDSARWHADGAIELFGRKDNQIKLRGYRIEPEEIEAALCEYPGIDACCVVLRPVEQQDSRLVAYYLSKTAAQPSAMQLRRHLGERLPRYMIPQQFTLLDELPLTPNAKLDRRLLTSGDPQPGIRQAPSEALRAPSSASEKYYAEIWRELLDADEIGVDDTFFDIGGHSLLSMQFVARVGSNRGIEIPLISVLLNSLGQLAAQYPVDGPKK